MSGSSFPSSSTVFLWTPLLVWGATSQSATPLKVITFSSPTTFRTSFLVFGVLKFQYSIPRCGVFTCSAEVHWDSSLYEFSFLSLEIISSNVVSAPFHLSSFWDPNKTYAGPSCSSLHSPWPFTFSISMSFQVIFRIIYSDIYLLAHQFCL